MRIFDLRFKDHLRILLILAVLSGLLPISNVYGKKTRKIAVAELRDKIEAAWVGQMIGNIYGLPHENKYINEPGLEKWPYGYSKNIDKLKKYNGAFSDDDTDVEYMYLLQMQKYGPEPSYAQIREAWMYHIRDRVWLANRAALGLMHFGYTPPYTGNKELNPHWYQIDPQLINEVWAVTSPGMVGYAALKSDWAARITSDSWGVEPTIHYGAMYSAAFFEKDVRKLIAIGLDALPEGSRYATTVKDMIALHSKYPDDWKAARNEMAKKYYIDEPDLTRTIWNANLNGACGILALLYGNGDFQRTLDLACAMGFDADNQAATLAGLMGIINGMKGLPKNLYLPVEGWVAPFNNAYINITRYDLQDAKISDIIDKTLKTALDLALLKGGSLSGKPGKQILMINEDAIFNPPLEFCIGPLPLMEINKPVDYAFYTSANKIYNWNIVSGLLPAGLVFKNGRLSGTPQSAGYFNIGLQLDNGVQKITRTFRLLVRQTNLAPSADTILANVRQLNEKVLDSCWYTFGKSMYAKEVNILNDGILNGPGSVFYSLAAKARIPKVDYYGYGWKKPQKISMLALNTGCLEEFGGWFTSLNVQYLDTAGQWKPVIATIDPPLPANDLVYYQPHFVEYILSFPEIETKAIRVIGDAKIQDHWNKYTKNVSGFTSITELSVYP
ncbi:MAG: ADP-ribosylglycohydrolase family protein [Bacteroidota bacterium]